MFEQEIASLLEDLGYHVETNSAFLDRELEKSRELDARAVKVAHNDEANCIQVIAELLVECKDMAAPLVFVTRNKNARERQSPTPGEYRFPKAAYPKRLPNNAYVEVPAFQHLQLAQHHYYYREDGKATQFAKVVRKGSDWVANHEGIYDSLILPMAKALEARKKAVKDSVQGSAWRAIWLFFPIVVLREGLFVMSADPSHRTPEERQRVSFIRELDSEVVRGHYLTDFVVAEHLKSFIANDIQSFVSQVVELAKARPRVVRGDEA